MCTCMQYWQQKMTFILSLSHTHKHTNGSQVLWIIQWNKSKHNSICTQIQTPESSHGLWPSKHTDKEQTTLTDMQKSYTRPHQKVVLGMVLPWLWSVKATKTFGALVRPENLMQKFVVCSDSTLGASVHIIILNIKICTHVNKGVTQYFWQYSVYTHTHQSLY